MRTTISIDEHLLAQARQHAARGKRSFSALVEDALREVLARRNAPRKTKRVTLPVVRGARLPGVDYDSFAALLELTESR